MSPTGWPSDLPDSEHDPGTVRDLADEILADPKYDEPDEPVVDRIVRQISEFFDDVFDDLGGPFEGGGAGGGAAGALAWVVLFVLVGGVVAFVAWAIASGVFGRRGKVKAGDQAVVVTEEDHASGHWMAVAEEHEAGGRWREGLLCRYRALVVDLCDRGVISKVAGRTAGEYVRDLTRRAPQVSVSFARATDLFEEVWYGGAEAGPPERDRFAALAAETLDTLAKSRSVDRSDGSGRQQLVGSGVDGSGAS